MQFDSVIPFMFFSPISHNLPKKSKIKNDYFWMIMLMKIVKLCFAVTSFRKIFGQKGKDKAIVTRQEDFVIFKTTDDYKITKK